MSGELITFAEPRKELPEDIHFIEDLNVSESTKSSFDQDINYETLPTDRNDIVSSQKKMRPYTKFTYLDNQQDPPRVSRKSSKKRSISNESSQSSRASTKSKTRNSSKKLKKIKRASSLISRKSETSIFSRVSQSASMVSGRSSSILLSRSQQSRDFKTRSSKDSNLSLPPSSLRRAKKRVESKKSSLKKPHSRIPDMYMLDETFSDLSGEEESYEEVEVEHIVERNKILELLREIPDINDISETSWVSMKSEDTYTDTDTDIRDLKGSFVAPVDPMEPVTPVAPVHFEATSSLGYSNAEGESSSHFASTESSSLPTLESFSDSDRELFSVKSMDEVAAEGDDIAVRLTKIRIRSSEAEVFDFTEINAREQHRLVVETCTFFLDELIKRAVRHCEQDSQRLRRLLDKEKLITKLIPLTHQLTEESLLREKLQQWVTDHLVRKKQFIFVKTPKNFDALNFQRYRSCLIELDRLLAKQEATFNKCQEKSINLREELERSRIDSDDKTRNLENVMRQTLLSNDSFVHLQGTVDNVLSSMNRVRSELSQLRLDLLHTQHRLADIQLRSEALEDLGDGLKMREYLSKQLDTQVLLQKISERNADLNRLHLKINYDIHALAHLKGKEQMSRRTYARLKAKLKECEQSRRHHRDLIYQGKLKHNKLLRELEKIRKSGSLMFYPILMKDYDTTVANLLLKRESVEKLRSQHKRLTHRVAMSEAYLASVSSLRNSTRSSKTFKKDSFLAAGFTVTQIHH